MPTCGAFRIGTEIHVPDRARIGDREGPAREIVGSEPPRPRSGSDVADGRREVAQAHPVGVVDHRDDQALEVEVDRDPEPDRAVHDRRVAVDARVQQRKRAQRVDDGAGDERQGRQADLLPHRVDPRVVDRNHDERVRGRPLRRNERGRGAAAHVVEGDALVGGRRGGQGVAHGRREKALRVSWRSPAPREELLRGFRDGAGIGHRARGYAVQCGTRAREEGRDMRMVERTDEGTVAEAVADLELALVSRSLDDREIALRQQNRAFFQISGAGHEALLLGLARHLRAGYDWFFPYYRDRALALALGVTPEDMLLQAVGAADDPASGGRQMPCHWGARDLNIVSQTSCTGSQCLPAVGCAEAARYISRRDLPGCVAHGDELTYVSLGDGATSEGEFWESLNTACRLHLPVLYVVADNGYAISVRLADQAPAPISEMVRGIRGLRIVKMDGRDYFDVRRKGADAIAHVRAGAGPCLIHALVTRPYSHSLSDDQKKYRGAVELADEAAHDPIVALEHELVARGALTADQVAVDARRRARARSHRGRLRARRPQARARERARQRRRARREHGGTR